MTTENLSKELARYINHPPDEKNAFKIFDDSWSTKFSDATGFSLTNGTFDGCNDVRMRWLRDKFTLSGRRVLELGPLEAAHTMFLEQQGADCVAIEANIGSYLRCLIVKNHFNLKSKFILGDFSRETSSLGNFDLVVASGVLYHMVEPVRFLEKFAELSDRLFLWTHYFDYNFSQWHPHLQSYLSKGKWNYRDPDIHHYKGLDIKVIKQQYGEALGWSGFCGGPEDYSYWIEKQDLMLLLRQLGYRNIEVAFDDIGHQNGPSFCIFASK